MIINDLEYKLNKPIAGFLGGVHLPAFLVLFPAFFSWPAVALFFILHWATASVGICLGYHRYLTHRSIKLSKWTARIVVFLGTLACESGPTKWVAYHIQHHKFSDTKKDPHNANKGFWWAHFKWMLYHNPERDGLEYLGKKWAPKIRADKFYRCMDDYFIPIQFALGLILILVGLAFYGFTTTAFSLVIWGVFFRLVCVYHSTWFVNSAAHWFGKIRFKLQAPDRSTNCWWVGIIAYGEGWHNNHHAIPKSANHGMRGYEIDPTWYLIKVLEYFGLATNITKTLIIGNNAIVMKKSEGVQIYCEVKRIPILV